MKCEECRILIEDYADGALAEKASSLVNSHMEGCAQCSSFYQELGREQEIYARYERGIDATPLLWSSIEARINQERTARPVGFVGRWRERFAVAFAAPRLTPAFAAALVIIAIGVTVAVMSYLNSANRGRIVATGIPPANIDPGPSNGNHAAVTPATPSGKAEPGTQAKAAGSVTPNAVNVTATAPRRNAAATTRPTPEQLVREAEQKYLTAIAILSRDVNRQRSQLDPLLLARFDAALGEIDRTIKETQRVARENPGDPIALQYLLAAYSKKVDVLRGMTTD
jgi:tetratricopeptide (TPR) repeat protein